MKTKMTIEVSESYISRYGILETTVTDNGLAFASEDFENFSYVSGVHHMYMPPYYPTLNGQAERYIDTLKRSLARLHQDNS